MGTVDVHARRDLRKLYREIELASPAQLAMYYDAETYTPPAELRQCRLITTPVEACASTREKLGRLVDCQSFPVLITVEKTDSEV